MTFGAPFCKIKPSNNAIWPRMSEMSAEAT
jgi:hypothetical protein